MPSVSVHDLERVLGSPATEIAIKDEGRRESNNSSVNVLSGAANTSIKVEGPIHEQSASTVPRTASTQLRVAKKLLEQRLGEDRSPAGCLLRLYVELLLV